MKPVPSSAAGAGSFRHAIVIGGSMAGLTAAGVLADHFDRVTVIDRDQFPPGPTFRTGVPQARHIHALLARGYRVLLARFPALADELTAAGATRAEWGYDSRMSTFGHWMPRVHTGLMTVLCSRDLLEFVVRRHLMGRPNVEVVANQEVVGLVGSPSFDRVQGVRTRARTTATDGNVDRGTTIDADLIIDASGRGSHTPEWLKALGYPVPDETVINPFLRYVSRLYTRPEGLAANWKVLIVRGLGPSAHRGGIIYQIEGGRWLVTLAGANRDYPPLEPDRFLEFGMSFGEPPELYEALRHATPLTDPVGYQRTENRWRHYEALPRWPDQFVVLGDAVCAFNPIYGQGMTTAVLEAEALNDGLRRARVRRQGTDGLAQQVQRSVGKLLQVPWLMATSEDFRGAATEGPRPSRAIKAIHAYLDRVALCASGNSTVYRTYLEVVQLTKPPIALLRPDLAAQVLTTGVPNSTRATRHHAGPGAGLPTPHDPPAV